MLSIRFLRQGKKHQPSYKIVVVDKKKGPTSGKFVEQLGTYNPITKEKTINAERVKYWISQGAQPSDTLHNFLIKEGILEGKKIAVHSTRQRKKEKAKETPTAEGLTEETPKEEAPTAEEAPNKKNPEGAEEAEVKKTETAPPVEESKEESKDESLTEGKEGVK